MKIIIAGSRSITQEQATIAIDRFMNQPEQARLLAAVTTVISGGAEGPDRAGEAWGRARGLTIEQFYPDYSTGRGRRAPLDRNIRMAQAGDVLLAIWDGRSSGTRHMIVAAEDNYLKVYVLSGEAWWS